MLTPFLFTAIGEYAFLFFGLLTVSTIPVIYFCELSLHRRRSPMPGRMPVTR